jgi:lysophospholipase L1-like esterase
METPSTPPLPDIPFVNEVRLNWKNWLATIAILAATIWATPRVWKRIEQFETGPAYRIPYLLSKDYWLYQRRLEQKTSPSNILVVGDSVIWGEYVQPDGALSHFLNQLGASNRFVNAGVNGLYPLAIEGLINNYAPLRNRKIILHCNLLWMSSPKADLQENKAQQINHSRLLPQFGKIPSYRADANERLSAVIERNLQFFSWVTHLQVVYFNDKSIPAWTLADDGSDPPNYPNAYKNPLTQITLRVPPPLADDSDRGPTSPRHKPWTETGATATRFDWVAPEQSLQWAAFQRTLQKLIASRNDVLVVIGPFNEHMIAAESKAAFEKLRDAVMSYLQRKQIPFVKPEVLPSALYADGSHPLTEGYKLLAARLYENPEFQKWISR